MDMDGVIARARLAFAFREDRAYGDYGTIYADVRLRA
jgi:hypothetical protein